MNDPWPEFQLVVIEGSIFRPLVVVECPTCGAIVKRDRQPEHAAREAAVRAVVDAP